MCAYSCTWESENLHWNPHEQHTQPAVSVRVFVQVNVMSVISQGFDYRLEKVFCSQGGRPGPSTGPWALLSADNSASQWRHRQ